MNGSIDLEKKLLFINDLVFTVIGAVNKQGKDYYKIFNSDGIEVGGFKMNQGKVTGGLVHHANLVFSSYKLNDITYRRIRTGGRYTLRKTRRLK